MINNSYPFGRIQVGKKMDITFNSFLHLYTTEILPERQLSQRTLELYNQKFKHIALNLGALNCEAIKTRDIANFLRQFPPRSSNQYRSLLVNMFKYAIAEGFCESNPAINTIPRIERKTRKRLSLEGYKAIYTCAEQWLKNAMDLALYTLQRRADIVNMRFEDVHNGYLHVRQQKVQRYGSGNIRIKLNNEINRIIWRCRDSIMSPFLVHRLPERCTQLHYRAKNRLHPTHVLPIMVSRGFRIARRKSGYYKELSLAERPTFHEIRALGAYLNEENPRELLGHTEQKMTDRYLSGHKIRLVDVESRIMIG